MTHSIPTCSVTPGGERKVSRLADRRSGFPGGACTCSNGGREGDVKFGTRFVAFVVSVDLVDETDGGLLLAADATDDGRD